VSVRNNHRQSGHHNSNILFTYVVLVIEQTVVFMHDSYIGYFS